MNEMDTMEELSLGATLAQAREQTGLSQEEIAKKLYLSLTYIQHLEDNEFDKLCQSPVFIRGYVRGYARLVSLDETQINRLLDDSGIIDKPDEPTNIMMPRRKRQASVKDKKMRWLTYLIIVVLIVLVIIWWHSRVSHKQTMTVAAPAITQSATTPNVVVNSQAPVTQQAAKSLPPTSNIATVNNKPVQQSATNNLPHKLHMDMSNG